jgi:hypothetical protein
MKKVKLFGILNLKIDHDQHIYYDVPRINKKMKCKLVKEYPEGFDFTAELTRSDWQYREVPIIEDRGIDMPRFIDQGYFTYEEPTPTKAWVEQNLWVLIILGISIFIGSVFLTPLIPFAAFFTSLAYFIIYVIWTSLGIYEMDHPYAFINLKNYQK